MGLFSKMQRTHKAVPNQAVTCSEPFDLEDGMLVEIYIEGRWQIKQIGKSEGGGFYATNLEAYVRQGWISEPTEHPIRPLTDKGKAQARDYYLGLIQQHQDLIDHTPEKERIAELQVKVSDLQPSDQDTKSRISKANNRAGISKEGGTDV